MNSKFKALWFKYYVYIILLILLVIIASLIVAVREPFALIATFLGAALSTIYFVQKQKLEEIKLFKELFTEFNERYACQNDNLSDIKSNNNMTSEKRDKILDDYFNLCAEEYLFYKEGRIHNEVWGFWCRGMQEHLSNDIIKAYWEKAQKENSYYGLTTVVINEGAKIKT
jgi:hypothetical protein